MMVIKMNRKTGVGTILSTGERVNYRAELRKVLASKPTKVPRFELLLWAAERLLSAPLK